MADIDSEIVRLTQAWYEYVGFDHHKDRDCHWTIEANWSYGEPVTYRVVHHGYIADTIDYSVAKGGSFERAKADLLRILKQNIRHQQKWARECLAEPEEWMDRDEAIKFILSVEVDNG